MYHLWLEDYEDAPFLNQRKLKVYIYIINAYDSVNALIE